MSFKSNPKQGNNEMKKKNKEMKKKNKMWALLMSAVMLALGTAQAVPWNEDDVVVTYGDTAVTPTFYENVTLSFDGEAAKDGDVVAVFRGDNVFCGYGEVAKSNLEIGLYAIKDEPLLFKVWRSGTPDDEVFDVSSIIVDGSQVSQLLAPNSGATVSGLALAVTTKPVPETYTVTFDRNGGTGTMAEQTFTNGVAQTLRANAFTRTGYTFAGWATSVGGAVVYSNGQSVTLTANTPLYAKWTANTYRVAFDANGGAVSPTTKDVTYDSTYGTLPVPTRTGAGYTYTFAGWFTAASGGTQVTASTKVAITSAQTLYAHWTEGIIPPDPVPVEGTRYGLFIGINEYTNEGCGTLHGCDRDAGMMYYAWTSGGYCDQEENVKLFLDAEASKGAVRERLHAIAATATAGDVVLYFQSSHGDSVEDGSGQPTKGAFLCMADDNYSDAEFADDLMRFAAGVKIVVVIDACYSGGMFKGPVSASGVPGKFDFADRVRSIMAARRAGVKGAESKTSATDVAWITAADWNQTSEWDYRGSVFTMSFVDGWKTGLADADDDGEISFAELVAYSRTRLADEEQTLQTANDSLLESIVAGYAFDEEDFAIIVTKGLACDFLGTPPADISFPSDTTAITSSLFDGEYVDVSGIERVSIPAGVVKIGDYAFYVCENLSEVEFEGDREDIDMDISCAFANTPWLDELYPPPANDEFVDAEELYGIEGVAEGSNVNATAETGELLNDEYGSASTVWYRWTAPATGTAWFDTYGSDFDTVMGVLSDDGDVLTVNDDGNDVTTSVVSFEATAGTQYWISVGGYEEAVGNISLEWYMDVPVPANDEFVDAEELYGIEGVAEGSNVNATAETGELLNDEYGSASTVWYRWTAPATGTAWFDTYGSDFDTVMGVLSDDGDVLTVNDDGDDVTTSVVSFEATAGTQYWISVGGYSAAAGNISLFWYIDLPVPANDEFADAEELYGIEGFTTGYNVNATSSTGELLYDEYESAGTVWYRWTAPFTGTVWFDTDDSDFDTVLGVLADNGNGTQSRVVVNDDADDDTLTSFVSFDATAGRQYWISVGGFESATGAISLWWYMDLPAPTNDAFADAEVLHGITGMATGHNVNATSSTGELLYDECESASTVWYRWTAPVTGTVRFDTFESDFDTVLGVLADNGNGTQSRVAVNDDADDDTLTSFVSFDATAGRQYWISVGGWRSGSGVILLKWTQDVNTYCVAFNANGGTGAMAVQTLTNGVGQVLSDNAFKRFGYVFAGWSTSADGDVVYTDGQEISISSAQTLYAQWEEIIAGTLDTGFGKAQTVDGALYSGEELAGTVQVKVGKINARKQTVKVSASATLLVDGKAKKVTAKAVTLTLPLDGTLSGVLSFKAPIGDMAFAMAADGTFTLKNSSYLMAEARIGGALKGGSSGTFSMEGFNLSVPGEVQDDLLPYEEAFKVSGTKWQFAKAATVKWAKDRVTKEYGLVVDDTKGKTNLSGLKLTYTAKTGQFKGSFKAYALEEKNGRTKLVKYTVNVIGFVVDGIGYGEASCKKPAGGPWTVTVE